MCESGGIHCPLPKGGQALSHRAGSRALSRLSAPLQTQPPFLLLAPALSSEHDVVWSGIPLGSVGISCPSCVPFQSPRAPRGYSPVGWGEEQQRPRLCVSCSAAANTSLCYRHWSEHKSTPQPIPATAKSINSAPLPENHRKPDRSPRRAELNLSVHRLRFRGYHRRYRHANVSTTNILSNLSPLLFCSGTDRSLGTRRHRSSE